jgi:signal peptidase I
MQIAPAGFPVRNCDSVAHEKRGSRASGELRTGTPSLLLDPPSFMLTIRNCSIKSMNPFCTLPFVLFGLLLPHPLPYNSDRFNMESTPFPPTPPLTPENAIPQVNTWRRMAGGVLELLETVGLAAIFYFAVSLATARVVVDGPSMRPTLASGEWIVVNRLAYLNGAPQHGDVVVILPPMAGQADDLIKRVIGQPGDTIQIHGGSVYIDGQGVAEPYAQGRSFPEGEWKLGVNEVFLMGDNRELSLDSRSFGPVELKNIVGKAMVIYWPPAEWGLLSWRVKATNTPHNPDVPLPAMPYLTR